VRRACAPSRGPESMWDRYWSNTVRPGPISAGCFTKWCVRHQRLETSKADEGEEDEWREGPDVDWSEHTALEHERLLQVRVGI